MLAFLEYLYTDHCSIEEGDSVGILVLSNEYMMPRLTSLCELCIQREVDRTTSKCIAQADIDVICKYNTPLPSNLHTLIPSPRTIIPPPSYHHTPTLIPSYPYPHTNIPLYSHILPHTTPHPHMTTNISIYDTTMQKMTP